MDYSSLSYKDIKADKEGPLLWVTFNREKYANAFSMEMIEGLIDITSKADFDRDIRVIIFTGAGRFFSAGGDIKDMESKKGMFAGDSNELRERYLRGIQRIPRQMMSLQTPTIAMVNGAAIGAGLDFSLMCDIRVAAKSAKFGETFAKLGLVPGDGGTYFLQRVVGLSKAMEMTLTADVYSAEEALEMGLVSSVTNTEELKSDTVKIANKIASNAPIALNLAKRAILMAPQMDLESHLQLLASFQGITQRTSDHFEGLKAMKEKRASDFKGE